MISRPQIETTPIIHIECAAATKRTLTISPGSVRLLLEDGRTVELQGGTWEYGFASDEPLELWFARVGTFICTVNSTLVALDSAGPHWICNRPVAEDELFTLRFRTEDSTSTEGLLPDIDKPSAAQPTLIIRTKRNCPTGVSKPTLDE